MGFTSKRRHPHLYRLLLTGCRRVCDGIPPMSHWNTERTAGQRKNARIVAGDDTNSQSGPPAESGAEGLGDGGCPATSYIGAEEENRDQWSRLCRGGTERGGYQALMIGALAYVRPRILAAGADIQSSSTAE